MDKDFKRIKAEWNLMHMVDMSKYEGEKSDLVRASQLICSLGQRGQ